MDPCNYCGDRICCRAMCSQKKKYLDYIEGETDKFIIKQPRKKMVVTTNKNGIRREEFR